MGNTGSQALPQDVVDAAMDGDARKVCAFLDAGGDIDAQSTIGQTLLNFATYGHGSPRVHLARELLARGADPNLAGDAGGTPLHNTASGFSSTSFTCTKLLLEHGADPNAVCTNNGDTPLSDALSHGFTSETWHTKKIVLALLRAGAKLENPSNFGRAWTAEALLQHKEDHNYFGRYNTDSPDFAATKALIAGVRKAGSYMRYVQLPMCKDVMVLRALAVKGRATTTCPALQFLIDAPDEVAWKVLSFWRVDEPSSN